MRSIETFQTDSLCPGTKFLVFGAVHGNEPAGPTAINGIREQFDSGNLQLKNGLATWVPVANPKAFAQKKRFTEEDLNRIFKDEDNPESYEASLANELGELIKNTDVFLDIHTASAPGPTCVFIDFPTKENISFAEALGMEYAITGWPSLYASNPRGLDSFDTTRYAYEQGKIGVIVECGQHEEAEAIPVAKEVILHALAHFTMIDSDTSPSPTKHKTTSIRMNALEYKDNEGDAFAKKWEHLEPIPKGAVIATRASGEELVAEEDVVILLPKHSAKVGQEWFYLGVQE